MSGQVPPAGLSLPAAAIEQGDVAPFDWALTAHARDRHPAVRWWWGERVIDGRNGAYCYLCDRLVVTWQRSRPTPLIAIGAILDHRTDHRYPSGRPPGTTTAGKSPAVAAPPPEGQQ